MPKLNADIRRRAAVEYLLSLEPGADLSSLVVDDETVTAPGGYSFWLLTKGEARDAWLTHDNLRSFRLYGFTWIVFPL